MSVVCQHCGENALDVEEDVCHNCGVVSESLQLDHKCNFFSPLNKSKFLHWKEKKNTAGLDYGLDMLNMLCLKYCVSTDIKQITTDLVKEVYTPMGFRLRSDIGILAGCCLIHMLEREKTHVPIADLCSKLQCSKKKVFKYSKIVRAHLNKQVTIPAEGIKSEEMDFKEKLKYTVKHLLEPASMDDKNKLIAKTVALAKLADSCWLISGRSLEGVIGASAFLCWKSMDPSRQCLSFLRFCKDFGFSYTKGRPRVLEIKEMLLKLGQKIPAFTSDYVNEKNVLFHLNYILDNSETLRNDLLPNECTSEEIDQKEFLSFRKPQAKYIKKEQSESGNETKYTDNMNASDIEISDTEISSYIRTDEQVQMIISLREKSTSL